MIKQEHRQAEKQETLDFEITCMRVGKI